MKETFWLPYDLSDLCEAAAECGQDLYNHIGALSGLSVGRVHPMATFGVGYGVCSYRITGEMIMTFDTIFKQEQLKLARERQKQEDAYVGLARNRETYIKTGEYIEKSGFSSDEMIMKRAGVFVSLKSMGA